MKKVIRILTVLLCIFSILPCFSATTNADFYIKRAMAKSENDYKGIINDCTKAIQLDMNNLSAYLLRANAELKMGNNNSGAIRDYTKALQLTTAEPFLMGIYLNRGEAKLNLQDYKGTIDDENEAIRLNNANASAFVKRGIAKGYIEDFKGAADDITQAKNLYLKQHKKIDAERLTPLINGYSAHANLYPAAPSQTTQPEQTQSTYSEQSTTTDYNETMKNYNEQLEKIKDMYIENNNYFMNNINNIMQPQYYY